ncbi:hypothetical protein A2U01_0061844, partial [Trifolium medium]|nr:hypothetical protein [Trifolium medium]
GVIGAIDLVVRRTAKTFFDNCWTTRFVIVLIGFVKSQIRRRPRRFRQISDSSSFGSSTEATKVIDVAIWNIRQRS